MADNFNINTTQEQADYAGGMLPNGLNFYDAIAANATNQANQEQLVQQAVERSKQAKLQTKQEQVETETGGFLSQKGQVTKAQAIAELRLLLQKNEWEAGDIDKAVATAEQSWPDVLNASDIRGFIHDLKERSPAAFHATGQPFKASGKEEDVKGERFPEGTWIQETSDADGNQIFVRSNEPPSVTSANAKAGASDEKQWHELDTKLGSMIKTRFGATGMLATKIMRADSALNTLTSSPVLTKQDMENISTDIAAIYQGGVPGAMQIVENSYGTTLTNLMDTIRHYSGFLSGFGLNQKVLSDTKHKLMQVLNDMRNSALASMQALFESEVPAYKPLIDSDPSRWQQLLDAKMKGLMSGLLNEHGQVMQPGPKVAQVPYSSQGDNAGEQAAPARKTKSGISYTVNP